MIDLFLKPAHSCAVSGTVTSSIRQRHEEDSNEGQEERQRDVTGVAVFPLLLQGKQVQFVNREKTNVIEVSCYYSCQLQLVVYTHPCMLAPS